MEYFSILLILLLVTFIAHRIYKVRIFKNKKIGFIFITALLIIGIVWDSFAIYREHWIFPEESILGLKIGLMPVEEYLFILIIPYFVLTFYKILSR